MPSEEVSHACDCCHSEDSNRAWENWSLVASGALVLLGLIANWSGLVQPYLVRLLGMGGIVAGGWPLAPKAWRALLRLRPDINLLMLVAVCGAGIVGEWIEAATVVFLFGIAEWLEGWAERRSRHAVEALLDLSPKRALVKRGNELVETAVENVRVGDIVAVKSGSGVPVDGKIVSGDSSVDQAPITGESVPVPKATGDSVFAGSINGEGALEVEVTKETENTTLARIVRLVEEAQEQKAPSQRFVDSFVHYYTPIVTVGALLIFLVPPLAFDGAWMTSLYRACVLLIIACPCALVISTPVSVVAALTALARRGVLVKGGQHLENIARVRAIALDKTGTLTVGEPRVEEVSSLGACSPAALLRIAAAIDVHSSHPLAAAIVRHAEQTGVEFPRAESYLNKVGRGAQGVVDGETYFVGNRRFAEELDAPMSAVDAVMPQIEQSGRSFVLVGRYPRAHSAGAVLGVVAISDLLRPNAATVVRELHRAGIEKVVMLSGDNQKTADRIAQSVGIDDARGGLLPENKVAAVQSLREEYRVVAMIGDGVNDAPAMATASVGISMGKAGSDAAIETSDIALMRDDLSAVGSAVLVGRRTLGIIRFNVAFAIGLKLLFLVLTILGHASLWLAILADTGATLLVIANALRLLERGSGTSIFST